MPKKIMIVDDETLIRNLLKVALTDEGYDVVQVDDSSRCISTAIEEKPELIVMDINMPGMNGIEAVKLLKKNAATADIPAIILTGYPTQENIMNAIKAGAADVVTKAQICLDDIIERIAKVISKKEDASVKKEAPVKETKVKPKGEEPKPPVKEEKEEKKEVRKEEKEEVKKSAEKVADGPMNQANFESRMDKVFEVKTIPFVAKRVISIASSSGSTTEELVSEIQKDPTLAAKVLRLSNSAYYAAKSRITSLERAVLTIGRQSVGELASGVAVLDQFIKPEGEEGVDRLRFWEHCFCCASYARRIAQKIDYQNEDTIFLSGLLHSIGIAVFDDYFHKEFERVLERHKGTGDELCKLEKSIIGYNHSEVSVAILRNWGMSQEIIKPILLYKDSFEAIKMLDISASILKLSDILAESHGYDIGIDETISFIPKDVLDDLEITDEVILETNNQIEQDMRDLRFVFFMYDTSQAASYYKDETDEKKEKKYASIFREEYFLTDPIEILMRNKNTEIEIENDLILSKFLAAENTIIELTTPGFLNKSIEPLKKLREVNAMRRPPTVILVARPLKEAAEKLIQADEGITLLFEPFSPTRILESLGM